jgi:hypothetical protein
MKGSPLLAHKLNTEEHQQLALELVLHLLLLLLPLHLLFSIPQLKQQSTPLEVLFILKF